MKKIIMAVVISMGCAGLSSAESMAGKIGVGVRNDTFDVRYFVNDSFGVHAGTSMDFYHPDAGNKSSSYTYDAGAFYSKEITDGLLFQAGLTGPYVTGKDEGVSFNQMTYNPYVGAEFLYKGRFGFDFKVIPVSYTTISETGADAKAWAGGYGSVGAHIYF